MKKISKNKLDLEKISGIACYILLVIYENQLKDVELIENFRIGFKSNPLSGKQPSDDYYNKFEIADKLLSATNNHSNLINGFRYLKDKDFLRFNESKIANDGYMFYNFHLTDKGIDIIESSKDNPLKGSGLAKTFNLNFSPSINFDNLVRANNIVGVGGVASASLDIKTK